MKIVIHNIPPSNNKFLGKTTHYGEYQKVKREWHWFIKAAITEKPKEPYKKAIVEITYFFKDNRDRDPDNYSGKFILDALVKEGIIIDDNFKVISLWLYGKVDRENPRTEINIQEVKNAIL